LGFLGGFFGWVFYCQPWLKVHPTSALFTEKQPPYLLYTEIVHTKSVYMRDVTAIDPVWLEVLAPHFYEKTRVARSVF
jgi:ATP-dependent RNA helicase DDX35